MSFYYLQEEMGLALNDILDRVCSKNKEDLKNDLAITWINYKSENNQIYKGFGFGINNKKLIYPASIVKLVYGLAAYSWIETQKIQLNREINDAVNKMLFYSSNDATSFLIDILTGTTSGPCMEGDYWQTWKYQRSIINDWLKDLNWNDVYEINCCQKTWDDGPFGREKEFYGTDNKNRNMMTTDATARILEEIMIKLDYQKDNLNLRSFLKRNLKKNVYSQDPLNQIDGFLGAGLPEGINFWSKAGLMSKARHDAAWWVNNDSLQTLLVVFGNGQKYFKDETLLPEISKAIYKFNNNLF
jgi:beta-lactamase class A